MKRYLQISLRSLQLLQLWQTNTKRCLIAAVIEWIINIIETEVKLWSIQHHTQLYWYCTRTQQISLAIDNVWNIAICIWSSFRQHIDFMFLTQRKPIPADCDFIAGRCRRIHLICFTSTIDIPDELNIIQCYLTACIRVCCNQLSLDIYRIAVCFTARNLIIRNDITLCISNDWMLANHFKPVTVQRADFSRCSPICLTRLRVLCSYRYIILLICFKRIISITDNDISFTFTILLNHRSTIDLKVLTGFL